MSVGRHNTSRGFVFEGVPKIGSPGKRKAVEEEEEGGGGGGRFIQRKRSERGRLQARPRDSGVEEDECKDMLLIAWATRQHGSRCWARVPSNIAMRQRVAPTTVRFIRCLSTKPSSLPSSLPPLPLLLPKVLRGSGSSATRATITGTSP